MQFLTMSIHTLKLFSLIIHKIKKCITNKILLIKKLNAYIIFLDILFNVDILFYEGDLVTNHNQSK